MTGAGSLPELPGPVMSSFTDLQILCHEPSTTSWRESRSHHSSWIQNALEQDGQYGATVAEIQPLHPVTKLNLRYRVLHEVEEKSFTVLPGIGDHSGLTPSNLEWVVRSFIEMVQRGRDQLADILLIGWQNRQDSASLTFCFQLVWDQCACGPHTVNSSHLVGILVAAKLPKDIVMYTPGGYMCMTRTLSQGYTFLDVFLDSSSLLCLSIPSLF